MSRYLNVQDGVIVLPADVCMRTALDEPGAHVELVERDDGILELRPCNPAQVIPLSPEDSLLVAEAILNPPELNERMRRAVAAHRKIVRE